MAAISLTTPQGISNQAPKELAWASSLLKLEVNSLDQLASGAIFCQLLDIIYNGMVPMDKVNWNTEKASEFVQNFELLKAMFIKFAINQDIKIDRLVSGDRADLFNLLKWMHIFSFSTRNLGKGYDPVARRFGKVPHFGFAEKIRSKNQETDSLLLQNAGVMKQELLPLSNKENQLNIGTGSFGSVFLAGASFGTSTGNTFRVANLDAQIVQKLAHFDTMQKENEFYLNKLKEIDLVLDSFKNGTVEGIIQTIKDIINLPQEKIGFVTEDGRFQILASVNSPLVGDQEQVSNSQMQTEHLQVTSTGLDRFDRLQNISANFGGTAVGSGKQRSAAFIDEEEEGLGGLNLLAEEIDQANS